MSISELYRSMGSVAGPTGTVDSGSGLNPGTEKVKGGGLSEFEKVLRDHQLQPDARRIPDGLKFSNHAETRIRSRMIPWNEDVERRVSGGIDSAKQKGSRETLILAGDVAVIANVHSRTVITAMDASNLKERIFTNIDSAVIV